MNSLKAKFESKEIENKHLRETILIISEINASQYLISSNEVETFEYRHLIDLINILKNERRRLESEVSILGSSFQSMLLL